MEIYVCYTDNDGYCYVYVTCASTGKAAVAISGTTVHTALKISLSRLLPLHSETAQQYRSLFKYFKRMIIDEITHITKLIEESMEQYHKNTCVRFVKRTNERDYLDIKKEVG
ncbi:ATP-dependent DNA helicase [Trichonephila clavipes]|nr:ATP-dependent DNA helicase [Trichonephila clavipes]